MDNYVSCRKLTSINLHRPRRCRRGLAAFVERSIPGVLSNNVQLLIQYRRQVHANNSPTSQRNTRHQSTRRHLSRAALWRQSFLWDRGWIVCERSAVLRFSSAGACEYPPPSPTGTRPLSSAPATIGRARWSSRRHFHPARAEVALSSRSLKQAGLSATPVKAVNGAGKVGAFTCRFGRR